MPDFGTLLPPPPAERRGIPLYYAKSEEETRQDVYERYDELVARQTALHLADELHGEYPLRDLLTYVDTWRVNSPEAAVADIGCSVGRIVGELATHHSQWDCYGIDFSYQMLRQANEYWREGLTLTPNLIRFGFPALRLTGTSLPNVHFALADASALPFADNCLDLVVNTFLIDRLSAPFEALAEWQRVLKPGGRLITVSPLNFLQIEQWKRYYPPMRIVDRLLSGQWTLLDLTEPLPLSEPMDARGNAVHWQTLAFVLEKRDE